MSYRIRRRRCRGRPGSVPPAHADEREGRRLADLTYTLEDVLSKGFEARCVGPDGARYLWHGECGLRVDAFTGQNDAPHRPVGAARERRVVPDLIGARGAA